MPHKPKRSRALNIRGVLEVQELLVTLVVCLAYRVAAAAPSTSDTATAAFRTHSLCYTCCQWVDTKKYTILWNK